MMRVRVACPVSPFRKVVDEGEHVLNDAVEEAFAFFGGGEVRVADSAGFGYLMELVHVVNRAAVLHVGLTVNVGVFRTVAFTKLLLDAVGMKMKHDGRFHF